MRAGVFLAYWPWFSPAEQVELAVLADRLGLDSVWVAEAWGQDAVSVLGLLAGRTRRGGLGAGVLQMPARQRGLVRRAVHRQPQPDPRLRRRRAPHAAPRAHPAPARGRAPRPAAD